MGRAKVFQNEFTLCFFSHRRNSFLYLNFFPQVVQQNIVSPKIERLKLPNECGLIFVGTKKQGYILAISSPPWGRGGIFVPIEKQGKI